jgi:FKBP-type peptidyl-prolyl cis-trans isomerase FkpA
LEKIEMKKYLLLLGVCLAITFSSCRKIIQSPFNADQQAKYDDQAIQDYFTLNQITDVTKDASGLYYHIDVPGNSAHPTSASNVVVNYTAFLLDETKIDEQPSYYFELSNIDIEGWRIGLPKIGVGGTITLYVPSGLAFGEAGGGTNGEIPSNSPVIYHITLQGFTN